MTECDNCHKEHIGPDAVSAIVIFKFRVNGRDAYFLGSPGCLKEWAATEL